MFDQVGSTASPSNPMLLPLANNGGPTLTHAPQLDSPVIDRGFSFASNRDQRGSSRPENNPNISDASDGADIGSFELRQGFIFSDSFEGILGK